MQIPLTRRVTGGAGRTGTRGVCLGHRLPPSPLFSLGPRAGRRESPRGFGPAAGSREPLSGSRDSRLSALRQLGGCAVPPLPRHPEHASYPPPFLLTASLAPTEPRDSELRPGPEALRRGREQQAVPGGRRRTCALVRCIVPHAPVGSSVASAPSSKAECGPADTQEFSEVPSAPAPKAGIPNELLLFPTQE